MTKVYTIKGKSSGKVKLPSVFKTEHRPDLIQRAVVSIQTNRRQPYSPYEESGQQTSADYFGRRRGAYRQTINRGMSRLPREKPGGGGLGAVRIVPQAVGGRRAHPPKGQKRFKKINKKEYNLALKSAIGATTDKELISKRGHIIEGVKTLPLIIEDKFENLNKTKDVVNALNSLGLNGDLQRSRKKTIRAGKGKGRGRKYKKRKSLLIVVNEDKGIISGVRNIEGVDAVKLDDLDVELLAPGTHPGRLTLWTESAIKNIDRLFTQPT